MTGLSLGLEISNHKQKVAAILFEQIKDGCWYYFLLVPYVKAF
jgi:hypothetical protein